MIKVTFEVAYIQPFTNNNNRKIPVYCSLIHVRGKMTVKYHFTRISVIEKKSLRNKVSSHWTFWLNIMKKRVKSTTLKVHVLRVDIKIVSPFPVVSDILNTVKPVKNRILPKTEKYYDLKPM